MMRWTYLPFLLAWALPVLALQWLAGGRYLWRERRRWPWVVLGLGGYLSLADAVAIAAGVWRFNAAALIGIWLGPLPLEEALFYLLTAAMVVQGFVIAWAAWDDRHALVSRWQRRLRAIGPSSSDHADTRTGARADAPLARTSDG